METKNEYAFIAYRNRPSIDIIRQTDRQTESNICSAFKMKILKAIILAARIQLLPQLLAQLLPYYIQIIISRFQ